VAASGGASPDTIQKISGLARPEARPLDHQTMKDKRIMPNPVGFQPHSSLNYFRVAVTCYGSQRSLSRCNLTTVPV
jgi:hypothetical protein